MHVARRLNDSVYFILSALKQQPDLLQVFLFIRENFLLRCYSETFRTLTSQIESYLATKISGLLWKAIAWQLHFSRFKTIIRRLVLIKFFVRRSTNRCQSGGGNEALRSLSERTKLNIIWLVWLLYKRFE